MPAPFDLVGRRFGRLTVLSLHRTATGGGRRWRCLCDCQQETIAFGRNLGNGHTTSCGCLRADWNRKALTDTRPILIRLAERSQCDLATGCIVWNGSRKSFGHGMISVCGQDVIASRAAWMAARGAIPEGLNVLHRCDNPPCWNVDHLFLGTHADNTADMISKGRERHPQGEDHGNAKLTEAEVRAIRIDTRTLEEIAADYDVVFSTISGVRRRATWRHVR